MLLTHSRLPAPVTGTYFGSPVSRIISAGTRLTNTFGALSAETFFPGSLLLTSLKFSSAGSLVKLSGSGPAGVHGPLMSVAFSHESPASR